ncbi:unnamed protein product [Acanthoscelides obtectus]|uniref:C2H2-type domain-containing protein n=2 Tax=Acanthoscelides obtectus TaxID=200917 RepID=A0A9P0PDK7_ACAOB|nr:unnamed protein product [Acanthoscelides obtectus]CAK1664991.1 Zinc finger protein 420 [Acanthoscelides obtectus]
MNGTSPSVSFEDFENICRACLKQGILKPYKSTDHVMLYQRLIDSKESQDKLHFILCEYCWNKLEDIFVFATACMKSEKYLRSIWLERQEPQNQNSLRQIVKEEGSPLPSPTYSDDGDESLEESSPKSSCSSTPKKIYHSRKAQPSSCEACQASFKTKKLLLNHQLKSLNCKIKNHKCTICSKAFFTKFRLMTHAKMHTSDTPFECKDCFKLFKYQSSLKRHVGSVHKGLKPFKCEICGKDFYTQNVKDDHESIQRGVRQYDCYICNSKFSSYSEHFCHEAMHKVQSDKTSTKHFKLIGTQTLAVKKKIRVQNLWQILQ